VAVEASARGPGPPGSFWHSRAVLLVLIVAILGLVLVIAAAVRSRRS
jgi:hypothetical protein